MQIVWSGTVFTNKSDDIENQEYLCFIVGVGGGVEGGRMGLVAACLTVDGTGQWYMHNSAVHRLGPTSAGLSHFRVQFQLPDWYIFIVISQIRMSTEADFNFKALGLRFMIQAKVDEDSFEKGSRGPGCVTARGHNGKVRLTIAGSSRDVDARKTSIHGL